MCATCARTSLAILTAAMSSLQTSTTDDPPLANDSLVAAGHIALLGKALNEDTRLESAKAIQALLANISTADLVRAAKLAHYGATALGVFARCIATQIEEHAVEGDTEAAAFMLRGIGREIDTSTDDDEEAQEVQVVTLDLRGIAERFGMPMPRSPKADAPGPH